MQAAIKVANDAVTIANLGWTLKIAEELREHRLASRKRDVLQLMNMLWNHWTVGMRWRTLEEVQAQARSGAPRPVPDRDIGVPSARERPCELAGEKEQPITCSASARGAHEDRPTGAAGTPSSRERQLCPDRHGSGGSMGRLTERLIGSAQRKPHQAADYEPRLPNGTNPGSSMSHARPPPPPHNCVCPVPACSKAFNRNGLLCHL